MVRRGMTREELELKKYIAYELRGNPAYLSVEQTETPENGHGRKAPPEENEPRKLSSVAPVNA